MYILGWDMVLPKVLGKKVIGKGTWFTPLPTNYVLGKGTQSPLLLPTLASSLATNSLEAGSNLNKLTDSQYNRKFVL